MYVWEVCIILQWSSWISVNVSEGIIVFCQPIPPPHPWQYCVPRLGSPSSPCPLPCSHPWQCSHLTGSDVVLIEIRDCHKYHQGHTSDITNELMSPAQSSTWMFVSDKVESPQFSHLEWNVIAAMCAIIRENSVKWQYSGDISSPSIHPRLCPLLLNTVKTVLFCFKIKTRDWSHVYRTLYCEVKQ